MAFSLAAFIAARRALRPADCGRADVSKWETIWQRQKLGERYKSHRCCSCCCCHMQRVAWRRRLGRTVSRIEKLSETKASKEMELMRDPFNDPYCPSFLLASISCSKSLPECVLSGSFCGNFREPVHARACSQVQGTCILTSANSRRIAVLHSPLYHLFQSVLIQILSPCPSLILGVVASVP